MRPIDADRLYNTIVDEIDPTSISMDGGEIRGMMRTIIAAEPTIDAVPVTRCRDCVFSEYVIESNALPYYRCPYVNFDIYPDFYCAYGRERIADGRDHGPTDQG